MSLKKIIKIPEITVLKTPTYKIMALNPGCTLESFGELSKVLMSGSYPHQRFLWRSATRVGNLWCISSVLLIKVDFLWVKIPSWKTWSRALHVSLPSWASFEPALLLRGYKKSICSYVSPPPLPPPAAWYSEYHCQSFRALLLRSRAFAFS